MAKRVLYVTLQDEDGRAVGGRLHIEDVDVVSPYGVAFRNEAGYLLHDLIKELDRG